jgi:hypothetical protein
MIMKTLTAFTFLFAPGITAITPFKILFFFALHIKHYDINKIKYNQIESTP